ncbi:hypothetical protein FIBSPDRAFT_1042458 [Athelia psychrophila]|uniref:Uncharacterized protein n=1 Tax=Athelia psychrophila TaxID=1759441 RepID=A0A166AQL5_9AGAM|nr:hypothetical protein FIBSPDRAFT_937294 [Fibularhizoctonia sp. CBS 109695]KZP24178.1 hypothetical protein FIBSPDRAFT_1042458 [Fibularhizoctonia sp. CBS 109695]
MNLIRQSDAVFTLNHDTPSNWNHENLVESLPTEILMSIFEIGSGRSYPGTKRTICFEVAISHVSRRWRSVALGTPSLWTILNRESYQERLSGLAAYIERSHPLQLYIQIVIGRSGPKRDSITSFAQMIQPHLFRCRTLSVFSQSRQECLSFLTVISTIHAPVLDSLKLHCTDTLYPNTPMQLLSAGAPALKHLLMTGIDIRSFQPPMANVTAFSLKFPSPSAHIIENSNKLLAHMHRLVHLELTDPNNIWPNGARIHFGALRCLKLTLSKYGRRERRGEQLRSALEGIDAPLLEIVKITGAICHGACTNPFPPAQGRPSFPAVWHIILDDCFDQIDNSCLRTFALMFPNLSKLACTANPHAPLDFRIEPLIRLLLENRNTIWTQLRSLAVDEYVMQDGRLSVILMKKLYFARRDMGSPIRELQVPKEHIAKLKCLSTRATPNSLRLCPYYDGFPAPFQRGRF